MIVKCFSTQARKCKRQLLLHYIYKDKLNNNGYNSIYQLLISEFNCYIQVIRDSYGDVVYFIHSVAWWGKMFAMQLLLQVWNRILAIQF